MDKVVSCQEDIYNVDAIVDVCVIDGVPKYKVRWEGYGSDGDTWEPEENLLGDGAKKVLAEFRENHNKKRRKNEARTEEKDEDRTPSFAYASTPYNSIFIGFSSEAGGIVCDNIIKKVRQNVIDIVNDLNEKFTVSTDLIDALTEMYFKCNCCFAMSRVSDGLWKEGASLQCRACIGGSSVDINKIIAEWKLDLVVRYNNLMGVAILKDGLVFDVRSFLAHVFWNIEKEKERDVWPFSSSTECKMRHGVSWNRLEVMSRHRNFVLNQYKKTIAIFTTKVGQIRLQISASMQAMQSSSFASLSHRLQ